MRHVVLAAQGVVDVANEPADNRRTCGKCKRRFRRERGSRRTNCYECSPSRVRPVEAEAPPSPVDAGPGPIETRALADLQAVDRHETVAGLLVLALARDVDRGAVKPEQRGAAGQRLLQLLDTALAGTRAPAAADRLDEVASRRLAKAAAAS